MLFGTLQVGNPLLRSKEQCCLMHRSQNSASLKPGFLNVLPEYKLTVADAGGVGEAWTCDVFPSPLLLDGCGCRRWTAVKRAWTNFMSLDKHDDSLCSYLYAYSCSGWPPGLKWTDRWRGGHDRPQHWTLYLQYLWGQWLHTSNWDPTTTRGAVMWRWEMWQMLPWLSAIFILWDNDAYINMKCITDNNNNNEYAVDHVRALIEPYRLKWRHGKIRTTV
jgi:hypothetical protein